MKISDIKCMALAMAAVCAVGFTACNDTLEVLPLEYKEDPNFAPPHINPAWNLVEISDMAGAGSTLIKINSTTGFSPAHSGGTAATAC